MDNIRKIHHVCRIRLRKTFITPRFYVALLWVLLEFQGTTSGIRMFCKTSEIDVTFWILPFLTHRCFAQVMISLGALLLFCDAPFLEPDSSFQILRAGRKNWFWGNVLYLWILSLIYTVCIAVLPVLLMFPYIGWENGWGKVLGLLTTDAAYSADMEALNGLIISRFSVLQAMALTMLVIWILTVMIGMAVYAGNFLVRREFGVVIGCGIALTALLLSKFSNITIGYYCAPPLWMNIASYKWQGYGNGPSMAYVYSVFAAVIGACTILSYLGIRKKDLNFVEEI